VVLQNLPVHIRSQQAEDMAPSGAGAASKEAGAEAVIDVDTHGAPAQTKDAG